MSTSQLYSCLEARDLISNHYIKMITQSLAEISKSLESLIQKQEARVHTFVETGYDETGMVATADGYLCFAKGLIDFVAAAQEGSYEIISYGSVQGPGDSSIGYIFSPISDVKLDSALLVKNEDEAEKAIRYFQPEFP